VNDGGVDEGGDDVSVDIDDGGVDEGGDDVSVDIDDVCVVIIN
jgi:hypothetical protein